MPSFFDLGLGDLVSAASSIFGGMQSQQSAERIAAQNIANQRDFAQHGVSWKVADARSAGISPLAALGASTNSFSNVVGSDALGEGISKAGQDVGRAVKQAGGTEDRELLRAGAKMDIEGKRLDNEIKRAELASKIAKEGPEQPSMPGFAPAANSGQGDAWKGNGTPIKFTDLYGNKATPMIAGGMAFDPSKRWSDSNQFQNRWGDTIQDIIAPFALDQDMKENMGQRIPEFLWKWANQGSSEYSEWLKRNGIDALMEFIRSGTNRYGRR